MEGRLTRLFDWLKQSSKLPIEIILVHDEGIDKTGIELESIVDTLQSKNIILIHGIFGSPGEARNAGLNLAKAKWISFWDSDDSPEPLQYLSMLDSLESSQLKIAAGGFRTINEKSNKVIQTFSYTANDFENIMRTAMNPGIWRFIIGKDLIKTLKFTKIRAGEDQLFLATLLVDHPEILFHKSLIYSYVINPDIQNSRKKENLRDLAIAVVKTSHLKPMQNRELEAFLNLMIIRQGLTYIKNFQVKSEAVVILKVLKALVENAKRRNFYILRVLNQEKLLRN